jgi:predicted transposase/invertase (TIGR01784 family)
MKGRDYLISAEEKGKAEGISIGEAKGIEKGKTEGISIGEAKGIEKGKAEGKAELIKMMLDQGNSIDTIAKITGLPASEIQKLI